MTFERAVPSGAWMVTDLVGGVFVTRTYYGYTKREAGRLFREATRGRK